MQIEDICKNDEKKLYNCYLSLIYLSPLLKDSERLLFSRENGIIYQLRINNPLDSPFVINILQSILLLGVNINSIYIYIHIIIIIIIVDCDKYECQDLLQKADYEIRIGSDIKSSKIVKFNKDKLCKLSHSKKIPSFYTDIDITILKTFLQCYKDVSLMNKVYFLLFLLLY